MNGNGHRPFPSPGPECASFADVLPLLGENTLDAETSAHLRQHVGTCTYCQAQAATDTRIADIFAAISSSQRCASFHRRN